jgi:tubulin-specific chaperone D
MSDDTEEGKLFRSFERRDEFVSLQNTILALDLTTEPILEENRVECDGLRRLSMIVCMSVRR